VSCDVPAGTPAASPTAVAATTVASRLSIVVGVAAWTVQFVAFVAAATTSV